MSEELPNKENVRSLSAKENPVYYQYLLDYEKQLREAFQKNKYNRNHVGAGYEYFIHKDGTITDMKDDLADNMKIAKIVKEIIIKNPPPPFYDGMDEDVMYMDTYLGIQNYKRTYINYYLWKKCFTLDIVIKHK